MRQRRFPCHWRGANLVVRAAASTPPVSGPGGERAGCATGDRRHVSPAFLLVLPVGIPSLRTAYPRRRHALPLQARALPAALVAATGAGFQRSRSNTPRLRCAARCCCIWCGGRLHAVCASRRQDGEGNPMTGAAGMRGRPFDVQVDPRVTTNDLSLMINAALAGGGITFGIEACFRPWLERGELVPLLQDYLPPFPGFFLYYPDRRHAPPKLRALVDHVRALRTAPPWLKPRAGTQPPAPAIDPTCNYAGRRPRACNPNGDPLEEDPAHRRDPGRPWPGGQRQRP